MMSPNRVGVRRGKRPDLARSAAICYSKACASYECRPWLPFAVMPGWEDDLYCLLLAEEKWIACREANRDTHFLAVELRKKASPSFPLVASCKKVRIKISENSCQLRVQQPSPS
jgi:hypothetical protein